MESQWMHESLEAVRSCLTRRSSAPTLLLSFMLLGVFTISILAMPAHADDRGKDKDNNQRHSLVMQPYSEHSLRAIVTQLQTEVAALKKQLASSSSPSSGTGPTLTEFNSLKSRVDAAELTLGSQTTRLETVEKSSVPGLATYLKIDTNPLPLNGLKGPHLMFTGANVHVLSGSGATDDGGVLTGLGNLIVGYNEAEDGFPLLRTGSHNLVAGVTNNFSSYGGVVFGLRNHVSGMRATILGGLDNQASGASASVHGGTSAQAKGFATSILGGRNRIATTDYTSIPTSPTN